MRRREREKARDSPRQKARLRDRSTGRQTGETAETDAFRRLFTPSLHPLFICHRGRFDIVDDV